jgi:ABC-type microcin C transport system permease subunit YejE
LTPKEARKIMRSLNQPDYQDDSTLLAMTKDFATRNVDTFLSTYENKDSYLKSDVMEAIAAKVIEHDLPTGDIKLSGTVIANIKVSNPDAFPESFVKWLNTSENGKDVLANIKAHMAKKQSA